jgi:hypothetical protein
MKKWFAILAVLVLLLSGCAKADLQPGEQPQNPVEEDQVVIEKLPELEPILAEKDSTITDEQRKLFFDLVKEYRVDAMPEFSSGNPIELNWLKYYCAYFVEEDEKTFVSGGVNYTGAAVERIAKRFGISYGLKDDDQVFVKAGSLMSTPFAELIQYKEELAEGKTLVTARCVNYQFSEYNYNDYPEGELTYPKHRSMVIGGKASGYEYYEIIDFSFYTEDGKTPSQFVSHMRYLESTLKDGTQTLPEF